MLSVLCATLSEISCSCRYETFRTVVQLLRHSDIKFARWQHPAVWCRVSFAVPNTSCLVFACQLAKPQFANLSQYLASLRAVKRSSGKCKSLSCDEPRRVYNTVAGKRPSLFMVGNNDEVYDKKSQRYVEDNVTQW